MIKYLLKLPNLLAKSVVLYYIVMLKRKKEGGSA